MASAERAESLRAGTDWLLQPSKVVH